MDSSTSELTQLARYRSSDLVRIRSDEEILSTLDVTGRLEGLPFMPEMLRHCGETVRVFKRAHKTCDSIWSPGMRRMERTVFLQGLRCDGSAHGGCQAACLFFWKEQWLTPAVPQDGPPRPAMGSARGGTDDRQRQGCSREDLHEATRAGSTAGAEAFACQATELARATVPLPSSDVSQFAVDVTSGNVAVGHLSRVLAERLAERIAARIRRRVVADKWAAVRRDAVVQSPDRLDLKPGDRVAVRSKQEIEATLDSRNRNRGLHFSDEMQRYCGGEFRVQARVERIIHEPTGQMRELKDCVILEDVSCQGDFHRFCPRAVYLYWREAWLRKLD